jgi:hypothetical protein
MIEARKVTSELLKLQKETLVKAYQAEHVTTEHKPFHAHVHWQSFHYLPTTLEVQFPEIISRHFNIINNRQPRHKILKSL